MLNGIDLNFLATVLRQHWVSGLFMLLTALTLLSILLIRHLVRRRLRRLLVEESEDDGELDHLAPLTPRDHEALALVKELRGEVWEFPDVELQLSIETLSQRAFQVVRSVAAVYHPGEDDPQYEASLFEMLQLTRRVVSRVQRIAGVIPFKYLGTRKLSDYQRYYEVYRKINESPILQAIKRYPTIFRLARLAMNVKNLGNPLYWAGKELSREGYFYMVRWFHLTFVSQVGREAIRLYSGRHFQSEVDRDAVLLFYRLYALTRQWGGPSGADWAGLVEFLTGHTGIEAEGKLQILSRWTQNRLPKDLDQLDLQTPLGRRWYRNGLKALLEKDTDPLPGRRQLIEAELARLQDLIT
jgi:hypothetical protein